MIMAGWERLLASNNTTPPRNQRSLRTVAGFVCALAGALCVVGCGVSSSSSAANSSPPAIAVSISPSSASVATGGVQQFTANVTGTSSTGVKWSASGGTISSTGVYTAGNTAGSYTG